MIATILEAVTRQGLAAMLIALSALTGSADAQTRTLAATSGPAETPPAGYAETQYVDSGGCVFVRVGLGGTTRWVPRVNRDRTVVCGRTPSIARGDAPAAARVVPAVAPAPAVASAVAPVLRREPAPAPPPRAATPADRTVRVAPRPAQPAPDPRPVTPIPARRVAGAAAPVDVVPMSHVDATIPSPWLQNRRLRAAAALRRRENGAVVVPGSLSGSAPLRPPAGYVRAWRDGRLNPDRGPRTLRGDLQTRAIWTDDVPRQLRSEVAGGRR